MLNKRQKEVFVKDGLSATRRNDFNRAQNVYPMSDRCLDELLKFLKDVRHFSSAEFLLSQKSRPQSNNL